MPDAYGNLTEAERRALAAGYAPNTMAQVGATPVVTNSGLTYTNGHHYAGTNVPMSDQAYAELTAGGAPLATDRDVLGGGQYGVRNWLHDNPGTVVALAPLLAYGGSLLAGAGAGAGAGGAGAGVGAGEGAGVGAGVGGGTGAGVGGAAVAAGESALPEIVVTGHAAGAGLTAGQTAALGAGAGGLGSALPSGGTTTPYQSTYNGNYGENGGFNQVDPNTPYTMGNASDYGSSNLGRAVSNGSFGGNVGTSSLWDDLIPAATQIVGSYLGGKGAKDASRAQVAAGLAGIAEQRREYDTARADQMPWLTAGTAALGRLTDPNAFTTSPGYNFVRGEALRDTNNSFAARGGALSGNAERALQDRAAQLANQEYGNWFNQTADIAGLGQTSAQSLGSLGQNNANNVSNLLTNQGNARASGILGATDAYTNGLNELGQWYGNFRRSRQGAY